jgi:hypothetical protein
MMAFPGWERWLFIEPIKELLFEKMCLKTETLVEQPTGRSASSRWLFLAKNGYRGR